MRYGVQGSRRARGREGSTARPALPVVLLAAFSSGCASSIMPVPGPRLSMVIDHGNLAFVKEGQTYRSGPFGGQIEEAVQGVPAAEAHARAYTGERTVGVVASFLGLVGVVAGVGVYGNEASHASNAPGAPAPDPTGLWVAVGGLVVETIGLLVTADSQRHLFDAINAYNDAVLDTPPPARVPTPARAPAPATQTGPNSPAP